MRLLTIISLFSILSMNLHAQDSTFVVLSQYNTLNNSLSKYYSAPALQHLNNPVQYTNMNINYSTEKSEKYIIQKGSANTNFTVDIESFQKKKNNLNLWGKFQYNNVKTKNVNFNETLDYDYLYPYIMSDTVGGNLTNEHYMILGGLSKTYNKTTYALEASFIGKQSTRQRDPRTNNISSNFNATFSVAQKVGTNYNLGLALIGERYFQKAKVSFNSELGRPSILHETGLGNYNKIFAGLRDNAEYLGYNYGFSLHYVPSNQLGWFATTKFIGSNIQKKIKDVALVINEANKYDFDAQLGYKLAISSTQRIEAGVQYNYKHISGLEGRFNNVDSQTGLVKISEENLFNADNQSVGGYLSYQQITAATTWSAKLFGYHINSKETYLLPAAIEDLQLLNIGGQVDLNQKIAKNTLIAHLGYSLSNPLSSQAAWTGLNSTSMRYQMLANNFDYKNTQVSLINVAVKLAIPVKRLQTFFIGANASYAEAYKSKHFSITSGFVF